jgi:periplasmic copper chaperone A
MEPRLICLVLVLAALALCSCGSGEDPGQARITVEGAWARPMSVLTGESASGVNSAVYLTLRNEGGSSDRLVAGETPVAEALEVHESRMEDGVMRMRPVDGVRVPAGGAVELKPGGLHLMLLNLRTSLTEGDTISLSLRFEGSGTRGILVPVRSAGER